MSDVDIAELLSAAYALHCAECDVAERQPILWRDFANLYKSHMSGVPSSDISIFNGSPHSSTASFGATAA